MTKHIFKCAKCSIYTMKETCAKCSSKTSTTKPAKYNPIDLYGEYRRKFKKNELKIQEDN